MILEGDSINESEWKSQARKKKPKAGQVTSTKDSDKLNGEIKKGGKGNRGNQQRNKQQNTDKQSNNKERESNKKER